MTSHIAIPDEATSTKFVVTTSQSVFAVPWVCFAKEDIRLSFDGVELDQTDFSFLGNAGTVGGFDGATITLNVPVASGDLIIWRDIPVQRTEDFGAGPISADDRNTALDRVTAMLQDRELENQHTLRVPIGESAPQLPNASERANTYLGFNGLGEPTLVTELPSGMVAQAINAYATATLASAANLPAGSTGIMTLGKSAVNDGGAAQYEITDTVHANERGVLDVTVNSVAKKARLIERVLRPEMFGISAASADNRQGFNDLQREIQYRGGGRVEFLENKTYTVYAGSDSLTGTTKALVSLSALKGFEWHQNGALIVCPRDMVSETWQLRILNLTNVERFNVDMAVEQTVDSATPSFVYGLLGLYLQGTCRDGFADLNILGGRSGIEVVQSVGMTWAARARNLELQCESKNVFYPVALERNGHDASVKVTSIDAGRALFLASVTNIDFNVQSDNSGAYQDVIITAAAHPEEWKSRVAKITGKYLSRPTSAEPPLSAAIGLTLQQYGAGADKAYMEDISIQFDLDCKSADGSVSATTGAVYADCQGLAGAPETVDRGHVINNIKLSGVVRNMDDASGKYLIDLWEVGKAGLGATSKVHNIVFEDIDAGSENVSLGFRIAASIVDSGLVFRNINAPSTDLIMDTPQKGALDASQSVKFQNFFSSYETWTSGSINQGYERLPNGRIRHFGRRTLNAGGSTDIALPIPFRALNSANGVFDTSISWSGDIPTGIEADLSVWLQAVGNLRIERNASSTNATLRAQWAIEGHI